MNNVSRASMAMLALLCARPAYADYCYVLLDAQGKAVHLSAKPPFDLSYPPYSNEYEAARARGEKLLMPEISCADWQEATRPPSPAQSAALDPPARPAQTKPSPAADAIDRAGQSRADARPGPEQTAAAQPKAPPQDYTCAKDGRIIESSLTPIGEDECDMLRQNTPNAGFAVMEYAVPGGPEIHEMAMQIVEREKARGPARVTTYGFSGDSSSVATYGSSGNSSSSPSWSTPPPNSSGSSSSSSPQSTPSPAWTPTPSTPFAPISSQPSGHTSNFTTR